VLEFAAEVLRPSPAASRAQSRRKADLDFLMVGSDNEKIAIALAGTPVDKPEMVF